ncbi:MAG: hypothetical protein FH761_07235 [Firmicutes bacterium]|nr:hypothetical protein [Bacillota bacterium]
MFRNKKILTIFTVLISLTIIASGCSTQQPNKTIDKDKVDDISDSGIRDQLQWQEYVNSRFGFSINFPKTWYKGDSSQNNDGIVLHTDNSSFDIRVYGANYLEDISKPYKNSEKDGFTKSDIKLNSGQTATLITGEENDMDIYEMVFVKDNIEYHFYAKVTKEYANEYDDVILNVIKTFNPGVEGEEKSSIEEDTAQEIIKDRANEVMNIINEGNMEELAQYVHPEKGVRFTPYTHVSLKNDLVFKQNQIADFLKDSNKYLWGYYDGSGKEIKLTPREYWGEFVYDKDYENADEISYNEIIGKSLIKENQFNVYSNSIIVEYYLEGTNPDYEGLDWGSLRLVFEEYNGEWYLVGIIHNQHVI